jgi:hypothetical protein
VLTDFKVEVKCDGETIVFESDDYSILFSETKVAKIIIEDGGMVPLSINQFYRPKND